jgi:hypothetical protein
MGLRRPGILSIASSHVRKPYCSKARGAALAIQYAYSNIHSYTHLQINYLEQMWGNRGGEFKGNLGEKWKIFC